MPVVLATWEAEIGKVAVQVQSGQTVHKTLSPKKSRAKWTGDVA
jgi:hypothetical protein